MFLLINFTLKIDVMKNVNASKFWLVSLIEFDHLIDVRQLIKDFQFSKFAAKPNCHYRLMHQ